MWKTTMARSEDQKRQYYIVDASQEVLGRMAERIAACLTGKDRPDWTPHSDVGGGVIVINASRLKVTGRKEEQIQYERYSGYPGGRKLIPFRRMKERNPEFVVRHAVRLMMPKNNLARHMLKRLKVYPGAEHPHAAQTPQKLTIKPEGSRR
jgi:large subunit ribosomal protein L13